MSEEMDNHHCTVSMQTQVRKTTGHGAVIIRQTVMLMHAIHMQPSAYQVHSDRQTERHKHQSAGVGAMYVIVS